MPEDTIEVHCRHCGAVPAEHPLVEDWLCTHCERYQDSTICPVCGAYTRLSNLPDDMKPKAAKAKKESA